MKSAIVAGITMFACLGFMEQVKAFNPQDIELFKSTGACPRCDLSGANLSEANLAGVNLRDANLRGANLTGTNLSNADLTGAD